MSVLPPGSWALVKAAETPTGEEQFQVHIVEPEKAHLAGYMWSSKGPLSEKEAADFLRNDFQLSETKIDELFQKARAHFVAQR